MKIAISDNLIKHYLENVYFINGHSYADFENDTREEMLDALAKHFGFYTLNKR